ncbi:hypothetical protein GE21DRAFT_1340691 [Neurospora crassa]|nr:hypothetical protein 13E11.320 [imported] - Neurospora crassa [Neurospora crassa]KHE88259.1 hypothetical protein GE21DRAFT_1340691 [Neurospora crassa]
MTRLAKLCSISNGFPFSRGETNQAINVGEKEKYESSEDGRGVFLYFLTKMKLLRGNLISSKNSRNGWGTLTLFDRFVAITCQKGWGRFELVWSNPPALGLLLLDLDVSSTHISEHSVAVELWELGPFAHALFGLCGGACFVGLICGVFEEKLIRLTYQNNLRDNLR